MPDWNAEIVEFAASFASLSVSQQPNGDKPKQKIRVRRGVNDLMHTLGYYFEQNGTKLRDVSTRDRLRMAAEVMVYIADNLEA